MRYVQKNLFFSPATFLSDEGLMTRELCDCRTGFTPVSSIPQLCLSKYFVWFSSYNHIFQHAGQNPTSTVVLYIDTYRAKQNTCVSLSHILCICIFKTASESEKVACDGVVLLG